MFKVIFGKPRAGKTSVMTYLTLKSFRDEKARGKALKIIDRLRDRGYIDLKTPGGLVYSDYHIEYEYKGNLHTAYRVDGFKIGLPNPEHETLFLPPYSTMALDEARRYYDARISYDLPEWVSDFYQLHGHNNLNIFMAAQRLEDIDVRIRAVATNYFYVRKLRHFKIKGEIVLSWWRGWEYDFLKDAEAMKEPCSLLTRAFRRLFGLDNFIRSKNYVYFGNIFNHYDSFYYRPLFFNKQAGKTFSTAKNLKHDFSLEDYEAFNKVIVSGRPDSFKKVRSKTKNDKQITNNSDNGLNTGFTGSKAVRKYKPR